MGTWLEPYIEKGYTDSELYATSLYWTITTITTVGYGDIYGIKPQEKIFCAIIMLIGVISFTILSGSMASIMTNFDASNAVTRQKKKILDNIHKNNKKIPVEIIMDCKRHLQYNSNVTDDKEIQTFIEEFPHVLRSQLILYIYQEKYSQIKFFKSKNDRAFIIWICPLLNPVCFGENQNIFHEGDDISNIYFLIKGEAGFVLPKYDNAIYIKI